MKMVDAARVVMSLEFIKAAVINGKITDTMDVINSCMAAVKTEAEVNGVALNEELNRIKLEMVESMEAEKEGATSDEWAAYYTSQKIVKAVMERHEYK